MASIEQELQQNEFVNEQVKANINILFTANWLNNRFRTVLKPNNLTHEQFNVLRILRGSHPEPMSQKDILSRMIARQSNLTLIIKKLKDKSFITVERAIVDRREYVISITDNGLKLLQKIDFELEPLIKEYVALSDSEAFHLNALLDKLRS